MTQKHKILIAAGALIAAFVAIAAWYLLTEPKDDSMVMELIPAATSTPSTPPSSTAHIRENAAYYEMDLTYPSITPLTKVGAEANAKAVAQMKGEMQRVAAEFKKNGNFANLSHDDVQMMGLDQRKMALSSEYKVYTGTRSVSYVFEVYEDTLGAHPNLYYRTFTYDTLTGDPIALRDLFQPSIPYLERVGNRARTDLPAIIKEMSDGYEGDPRMIIEGTTPTESNFQWFYIEGKNLVLVFPPYQVGPWALGTVLDTIPLAQFSDSLRPEYLK